MTTNRVQFTAIDIVPSFGVPIYIQQVEVPLGNRQHSRRVLMSHEGRTVKNDAATEYSAWRVLIHTQLDNYKAMIGVNPDQAFTLLESFVRVIQPGQSYTIESREDSIFSGLFFLDDPGGDMIYSRGGDSWFTDTGIDFFQDNLLNSNQFTFTPKEGNLTIYPSSLSLQVTENTTDAKAYVVEFYLK
tara:strand:+ start:2017 stop:2577 length:561 start_codon:yes stop_codon:yes gene_type:complete